MKLHTKRKKWIGCGAAVFVLCLILTACEAPPAEPQQADPILVFSERATVRETAAGRFYGTITQDLQQRTVLTISEPQSICGMTLLSSQTETKLQYTGMSVSVSALPGEAGAVLQALQAAARPGGLTRTEQGFVGRLSDGTAFVLTSDETGELQTVTLPGIRLQFTETAAEAET